MLNPMFSSALISWLFIYSITSCKSVFYETAGFMLYTVAWKTSLKRLKTRYAKCGYICRKNNIQVKKIVDSLFAPGTVYRGHHYFSRHDPIPKCSPSTPEWVTPGRYNLEPGSFVNPGLSLTLSQQWVRFSTHAPTCICDRYSIHLWHFSLNHTVLKSSASTRAAGVARLNITHVANPDLQQQKRGHIFFYFEGCLTAPYAN